MVTLTLFHREDEPLSRLMLDPVESARLDRLWEELRFVSRDALIQVDAFRQLMEYATQDSDPELFEPYRKPINEHAAAFRQALVDAEPRQVEAADPSSRAWPIADRSRTTRRRGFATCTPSFGRKSSRTTRRSA